MLPLLEASRRELHKSGAPGPADPFAHYSEIEWSFLMGKRVYSGERDIQQTDGSEGMRILVVGALFDPATGSHWFKSCRLHTK